LRILYYITLIVALFLGACSQKNSKPNSTFSNGFSLEKENDSLFFVVLKTDSLINKWELPYPVYQFQVGDINEDGLDDAIVGVIKRTRFDSTFSKRLFIFKNYNGMVRPLWMGSKLSKPLEDFCFKQTNSGPRIWTIEKEKESKYLVAEYKWRKFGLAYTKYIIRNQNKQQASLILKRQHE